MYAFGLFAAFMFLLLCKSIRVIPPAYVGIPVLLGSIQPAMVAGLHLVNPLASMVLFNIKTQVYFFLPIIFFPK